MHFYLSLCCQVLRPCRHMVGSRCPLTGLTSGAYGLTFSPLNLSFRVCWKHETTCSSPEALHDSVCLLRVDRKYPKPRERNFLNLVCCSVALRVSTVCSWCGLTNCFRSVLIPPFRQPKAQPTFTYSFNKHQSSTYSTGSAGGLKMLKGPLLPLRSWVWPGSQRVF